MLKQYLQYKETRYPLNKEDIYITINKQGVLFDSKPQESSALIKKVNGHYYLYPLNNDIHLSRKKVVFRKSYSLRNRDIIEINNIRVVFVSSSESGEFVNSVFAYLPANYKIKRILLEKEYYNVLLAEDVNSQHDVLIKILTKEAEKDIIIVNEFRRECRLAKQMSSVQHASIAKIINVESGMCPRYYVMENTQGISLSQYLAKHDVLPVHIAVTVITQMIGALNSLNETFSILHRDLTPKNIFLSSNFTPKIYNLETMKGKSVTLTIKGDIKGTFLFTAPEIYLEESPYTIQSDMYSLGLILICMLKGHSFFKTVINLDIRKMEIKQPYIKKLLNKMLDPLPQNRFVTYKDLLTAFANIPQHELLLADTPKHDNNMLEQLLQKITNFQKQQQDLAKSLQSAFMDINNKIKILEEESIKIKSYLQNSNFRSEKKENFY